MRWKIKTLNKKTRKDTQIRRYKAMAVRVVTFGSEIWTITKKEGMRTDIADLAEYTTKDQIRTTKIREELNF
jgi:hypothetical protein